MDKKDSPVQWLGFVEGGYRIGRRIDRVKSSSGCEAATGFVVVPAIARLLHLYSASLDEKRHY